MTSESPKSTTISPEGTTPFGSQRMRDASLRRFHYLPEIVEGLQADAGDAVELTPVPAPLGVRVAQPGREVPLVFHPVEGCIEGAVGHRPPRPLLILVTDLPPVLLTGDQQHQDDLFTL